jgi:ABC-2 type transport system ATP-binding protein
VRALLAAVPGVALVTATPAEAAQTLAFKLRFGLEDPRRALFDAVVKHDLVLLELHLAQASLEDTFRKLTGSLKTAA